SRLDVVTPNGGENWQTGNVYKIYWNSSNVTNVKIEYSSDNGGTWGELSASSPANLGVTGYDWTVPGSAGTNQHLIRVTDVAHPAIQDVSDSYFNITTLALTAPIGGEKWQAGKSYAIQWNSTGITSVKLEYTLDGITWGLITSSTPASASSYTWTLPSDTSSTIARVRITDVSDATTQKVSDNTFTVSKLRVTQPNGGENWQIGTVKHIKWVSANISKVDIKFAADGANFTTDLATNYTASSGSFNWTISQAATQNAKIKVVDHDNAAISDESDNVFQLNSLVLTSPNGGEKWQAGRTKTITWTNSVGVSNVRLEYSTNGGVSFVTGSPITASTPTGATGGNYTWAIPSGITASTNFLIKIIDVANTSISDVSNAAFEVRKLQLTEPIGTEIYQAGSAQKIYWTSENVSDVKIFYSSDNGVSWPVQLTAPTTPASNGTAGFSWTAPTNSGTQHRIKIVDSQTDSIYWISDNPFQIAQLALTSPTLGTENWLSGSVRQITWTSSGISSVKLEYTLDGVLWNTITNSASAAAGSYNWTLPADTSTTMARVRISVVGNPAINSQSGNEFTISRLKILNPNGGENLQAGGTYDIKWTSKNLGDVNLYYAADGVTWGAPFMSNIASTAGIYTWNIPAVPTLTGKIKIASSADPANIYVVSAGSFRISKLDLTSPNGGEKWQAGKTYDIKWTQTGINNVKLEYSTNGGSTYTQIISGISGSVGSYTWTIPAAAITNTAKIRISDETNSAIADASANIFTIYNLDLVSPNGSEIWQKGSIQNITWTSNYVNNIRIWYSSDNGATWSTTIAASVSAALGTYSWTVDKAPSNLNKIKISDFDNAVIADSSANPFIISELALTAPTGVDNWQAGSTQNITWTSNGIANVKLEYSVDNGLSWNDIVANALAADGTYAWTIPSDIYTTEARIRITNIANPLIFNVSDQVTIKRLKLTSPVGG
ncbi:MAG TPA: Ser-Thr-rich GPI-anchored membrane family protein, partial [Ignavibacteriales bacterium]|nr:Ser-Thr-rich GPI-anchored membrane family protein [Ignavibacteriales bacterium]